MLDPILYAQQQSDLITEDEAREQRERFLEPTAEQVLRAAMERAVGPVRIAEGV